MPRFVRPAFLSVRVEGRAPKTMSPLNIVGHLEADLTLRTPIGAVSRPIAITAGAFGSKGDVDATINIPSGFLVEVFDRHGPMAVGDTIRTIVITPTNEA